MCKTNYCDATTIAVDKRYFDDEPVVTVAEYKQLSLLYGLTVAVDQTEVNSVCEKELHILQHGINEKEIWAVKGKFI